MAMDHAPSTGTRRAGRQGRRASPARGSSPRTSRTRRGGRGNARRTSARKTPQRRSRPAATAKRTRRMGAGVRRPGTRRGTRPMERASERPMQFVELPEAGSSGSSYEPDPYTPKADLQPQRRRHRGFLGLFGRR